MKLDPEVLAKDTLKQARDAAEQARYSTEAEEKGEGDAQQAQSIPSSGDLPMFEANLVDPVDPMITDNHADQSSVNFHDVILSSLLPKTTKPKEIPHTNLESSYMNEEVDDARMHDLDTFSLAPKVVQWSF